MRLKLILLFVFIYSIGFSQNGSSNTIKIKKSDTLEFYVVAKDAKSNEVIPFANFIVSSSKKTILKFSSGIEGMIICKALKKDFENSKLFVECMYSGYKNSKREITIANGSTYEIMMINLANDLQQIILTQPQDSMSTNSANASGNIVFLKK